MKLEFVMRLRSVCILLPICVSLAISPATAAVIEKDVADLTAQAGQIVVGDVIGVTSSWNDDHTLIKSRVTIKVSQYLVGDGTGTEVIEMSGGTVGDTTLHVSVLPVFEEGDHVLLFLEDSPIRLAGCFQGAYLADAELAARMKPSCGRLIPGSVQPVESLWSEIRAALPGDATLPALKPYEGDFQLPLGGADYGFCGRDWTYKSSPMGEGYYINPNCADPGAGDADFQIEQILEGMTTWDNSGAEFAFSYSGTSSGTSVSGNGINLIFFSLSPPGGGDYIAANYSWSTWGDIYETDIVFNDADYTFYHGGGSCSGRMDIRNIITHELGHSLCLSDLYDSGDSQKTMYGYSSPCETKKRTLHSDDIAGIIAIYGGEPTDATPPAPDPMSFAVPPTPVSPTEIAMQATFATDDTPPVFYRFWSDDGQSRAWDTERLYTDTSLEPNTQYGYFTAARDSVDPPNMTDWSSELVTATFIETPESVSFGTVTTNSIVLNAVGALSFLTAGSSGTYFDSTTAGGDGGLNNWMQTTTDTATGLSPNQTYTFQVKARNRNALETDYSPTATTTTLALTPAAPTLSNPTADSLDLDVQPNGNPAPTEFAIECSTTDDPVWDGQYVSSAGDPTATAVWQTDADWGTITTAGLAAGTQYCFHVKARNADLAETGFSGESCGETEASGFVLGDMNCDGTVNFFDIDGFVLAVTDEPGYGAAYPDCDLMNADCNQDGSVDFFDIDCFVSLITG